MAGLYGGIEAGGTKFICAVGTASGEIIAEARFATTTPEETLGNAIRFFQAQDRLEAVGIGSFGPVDLDRSSPTYGMITSTPKPGWQDTPIVDIVQTALKTPVGFDTDVNAAALGEATWGAAVGLDTCIYLTIGTGIGGGVLINGELLHGLVHPELGHILLPHDREADPFPGSCPFHGDCFEGLAAGPAVQKRWGSRGEEIPADHPAWALEAKYIAAALAIYVLTLSPQRIILGGGVMEQAQLFPMIRIGMVKLLNGYVVSRAILEETDAYIVPPGLGKKAGVKGALALALRTVNR